MYVDIVISIVLNLNKYFFLFHECPKRGGLFSITRFLYGWQKIFTNKNIFSKHNLLLCLYHFSLKCIIKKYLSHYDPLKSKNLLEMHFYFVWMAEASLARLRAPYDCRFSVQCKVIPLPVVYDAITGLTEFIISIVNSVKNC